MSNPISIQSQPILSYSNTFVEKACIQIVVYLYKKPPIRFFSADISFKESDWRYQNKDYWTKLWIRKLEDGCMDGIGNCEGIITECEIFENLNGQRGKCLYSGTNFIYFKKTQH